MNRDEAERALQLMPLRASDPELIPAKRYYDPEFYEAEKQKLWTRVCQMACRLKEIPEVGDYAEYRLFEKNHRRRSDRERHQGLSQCLLPLLYFVLPSKNIHQAPLVDAPTH